MDFDLLTENFFRPGVLPEDLPALFPLLQARASLAAFIALFHGGDEEVLIRLLVLREIGARGDAPHWSPQQLKSHFAYLDETKLNTVMHRLRTKGLLVWDAETSYYQISSDGRMALSALSTLIKFRSDDGGEIGYISSQLAAGQAVGRISEEDLQHLLSRLNELQQEFNTAVVSGSVSRIEKAEKKLNSVIAWVEKGTEIIKLITADTVNIDLATHRVAQKIGQVQSRMLRMSSVFQRTLGQMERQKVHLGASGLSSTDINSWLRSKPAAGLAELLDKSFRIPLKKGFVLGDICLDVAEYELVERVRDAAAETALPGELSAPPVEHLVARENDLALQELQQRLEEIVTEAPLSQVIPAESFEQACYRLSMVAMLGDEKSTKSAGSIAEFMRSPFKLRVTEGRVLVAERGIKDMSEGWLSRLAQHEEASGGD
ncbi:MAG: hypothetical protein GW875_08005 [Deltaproteobacteria bacterium]|nr:hypothetical protein [Deltaproteobacteria bacterium]